MGLVIGVALLVVLISLAFRAGSPNAPWYLRMFPWTIYPFYRFSGSLVLLVGIGAAWYLSRGAGTPQRMLWFAVPGCALLALAFAKATVVVLTSTNHRWWMILLKINFALGVVVCFPLGLIALVCYWWFERDRVQDRMAERRAASRWANWRYKRSRAGGGDSSLRRGELVPSEPRREGSAARSWLISKGDRA